MPTLTPRQKQIYEFLNNYSEKRGVSPTHKEIGKKFRLVVSTVHEHLSALEKKGYIKKERGHARTIEATKREMYQYDQSQFRWQNGKSQERSISRKPGDGSRKRD